jgi:hypothetical protein
LKRRKIKRKWTEEVENINRKGENEGKLGA